MSELGITEFSSPAVGGLSYLEQVAQDRCSTPNRPLMIGRNVATKTAVVFRPRCKMWSCPECALTNQRLWEFKGIYGAQLLMQIGWQLSMITVTNLGKMSARGSIFKLPDQWGKLWNKARQEVAEYAYIILPEKHRSGVVHLHILATFELGSRWWKDHGASAGFGWRNEESALATCYRAGWYVTKYLSKSAAVTHWPPYFHRVRASFGWPRVPELEQSPGWEFVASTPRSTPEDAVIGLKREGYGVAIGNHRTAWAVVSGDNGYEEGVVWA